MQPLVHEIEYDDPSHYFQSLARERGALLLDSANYQIQPSENNRHSYILFDGFDCFKVERVLTSPFMTLKLKMQAFKLTPIEDLPPFQGGVAGYFSYDLCHCIDNIPLKKSPDSFPFMELFFYDVVISFCHVSKRAWVVSTGLPEVQPKLRLKRAKMRLNQVVDRIVAGKKTIGVKLAKIISPSALSANFTPDEYYLAVHQIINHIKAGDIFQANLSQQFKAVLPRQLNNYDLYCKLRLLNPAPFAAFVNLGDVIIASASPEQFLQLNKNKIATRPIKGTRPRSRDRLQDKLNAEQLLNSPKDRAENIMIVDLMRNDLSKVSEDDSIHVRQLCGLESFPSVHHLISIIEAQLKNELHATDLLQATFPGGSITGAPKIRAMQIITELEKNDRGPYCGSIGYIGFDGCLNASIIIRSYIIKRNSLTYQVGGGIVLDSIPEQEYQETLAKAWALAATLTETCV